MVLAMLIFLAVMLAMLALASVIVFIMLRLVGASGFRATGGRPRFGADGDGASRHIEDFWPAGVAMASAGAVTSDMGAADQCPSAGSGASDWGSSDWGGGSDSGCSSSDSGGSGPSSD